MALAVELKQMWGVAGYGGDWMPGHRCDEEWHERRCGLHAPHPVPSVPLSGSLMPAYVEVSCFILPCAPCNDASSQCGLRNNGTKTMALSLLLICASQEVFAVTKANTLARVPLSFLRPWCDRTRNSWPGASPQSGTFLILEARAKILFIVNNISGVLWQPPKSTSTRSNSCLFVGVFCMMS